MVVVNKLTIIPEELLVNAIMATRGIDRRTINKWMELFQRYKLIEPIDLGSSMAKRLRVAQQKVMRVLEW